MTRKKPSTKTTGRLPREQRGRFQRLPLSIGVRIAVLTLGWICVVLGVVGLFLPILQGGLFLAIGFALLSLASQWVHLRLRKIFGRWPGIWKRLEKFRRKIHGWLHRRARKSGSGPDERID